MSTKRNHIVTCFEVCEGSVAWEPPYRVDISNVVEVGENRLEIEVVNLWVNRLIGDEKYPEHCDRIDWQF